MRRARPAGQNAVPIMKRIGSSARSVGPAAVVKPRRTPVKAVPAKAGPKGKSLAAKGPVKARSETMPEGKTVKVPAKASHDTGTPDNLIKFMLTSWKPA